MTDKPDKPGEFNEDVVRKFTPDGDELPMDDEEREALLRAFAKSQAWQKEERRRRAIYGEIREIVTGLQNGRRYVAFGDTFLWVPENYIPYQFFTAYSFSLLGPGWEERIRKPSHDDEHPLVSWAKASNEFHRRVRPSSDGIISYMPNAEMVALFRLGYEGFIVQHNAAFRREVFSRIRTSGEFHGARNELSVGAFLAVAGFEVEYLPEQLKQKTPDMSASHKLIESEFSIEAKRKHPEKSSRRKTVNKDGRWKLGLRRRIKHALEQLKTRPRPWVLAIDPELDQPMPEESDEAFGQAVYRDVSKVFATAVPSLDPPELTILLQLPYHNPGLFNTSRYTQVRLFPSRSYANSASWGLLEPILRRAGEQFSRVPFTWDDLGDGPAGRALKTH